MVSKIQSVTIWPSVRLTESLPVRVLSKDCPNYLLFDYHREKVKRSSKIEKMMTEQMQRHYSRIARSKSLRGGK